MTAQEMIQWSKDHHSTLVVFEWTEEDWVELLCECVDYEQGAAQDEFIGLNWEVKVRK